MMFYKLLIAASALNLVRGQGGTGCPMVYDPVCCGGTDYSNSCVR